VPGGIGNFTALFSSPTPITGATSNGAVVFDGHDSAGTLGIYVKAGDGPLTKVISTGDMLDGKQIISLQLADGSALDQNKLAFEVQFANSSQAIYVATLTSVTGQRTFVKDGAPDTELDFPAQVQPAEIHGVAFNDLNRNGVKDD